MQMWIVLHNIRSAHNVGSLFRTADGAGVGKLCLCGYTPAPIDRFGRTVKEIEKTSLGATQTVVWEHYDSTDACLRVLREKGIRIVAIEQHRRSIPYDEYVYDDTCDTAFIFGNEIDGVPPHLCDGADAVLHIPMYGKKESLNVGVAAGIILFDARAKRR